MLIFSCSIQVKKSNSYIYFPILLDLRKFPCLVVGGGNVALRKVLSLLECNADVTVVSPKFCRELTALSLKGKIKTHRKPYSGEFIRNRKIVFSATDNPEVNRIVKSDCRRAGILLNVADNPSLCDFILPANVKRGSLTISVSTQGKAPFYAKELKRRLSESISPSTADIAELAADFRKRLLSNRSSKSRRAKEKAYKAFLKTDWENVLTSAGKRRSRLLIRRILSELKST